MLILPAETEQLVRLLAARSETTPEDVMQSAIERQALTAGVCPARQARQVDLVTVDAITRRSAGRPSLERRSVRDIRDDLWSDGA